MIRDAVTCDRPNCFGRHLERDDLPEGRTIEWQMFGAGWLTDSDGHTCPACLMGNGPVIELGECPRCGGSTGNTADGDRCHYCRYVLPIPDDDLDLDEDEGDARHVLAAERIEDAVAVLRKAQEGDGKAHQAAAEFFPDYGHLVMETDHARYLELAAAAGIVATHLLIIECGEWLTSVDTWSADLGLPLASVALGAYGSKAEAIREAVRTATDNGWTLEPEHEWSDYDCGGGEVHIPIRARMAQDQAADEGPSCAKCCTPFDPDDTRFDGHARYSLTDYCRGCVDWCNDGGAGAEHVCVICDPGRYGIEPTN